MPPQVSRARLALAVSEPAIVDGQVFAATTDGTLICLETGDPKATGWAMWGANAAHDGAPAQ